MDSSLLPAIERTFEVFRRTRSVDEVVSEVLKNACALAEAEHGSFVLVDHEAGILTILQAVGDDWTAEKLNCRLPLGKGLTGRVAAKGRPLMVPDTRDDPEYYPLFDNVLSELVVPVIVNNRVWAVINIDGRRARAFDERILNLLTVFAELVSFAITLRLETDHNASLQRQLLQSEKLASLGEALAGIAHEVNNPLAAILGHASLLKEDIVEAGAAESVRVIMAEAERAGALIRGVLEFSRKETGERRLVDLNDLALQAGRLKQAQLKVGNVQLVLTGMEEPHPVDVCPQQIKQVLLNLLANAEQSFPAGRLDGRITVAIRTEDGRVLLTVSDNGPGIPAEVRKRIFDPFFTTKEPGKGTGLGLSIAHTLIDAHGGALRLVRTGADGTVFSIDLPLSTGAAVPVAHGPGGGGKAAGGAPEAGRSLVDSMSDASLAALGGGPATLSGRILVVDDEPHVLDPIVACLRGSGLEVRQAIGGAEAVTLLRHLQFDIILTDIRMPGVDGLQLYRQAGLIGPGLQRRFIFMSGDLLNPATQAVLTSISVPCLEKPFSFDDLLALVSSRLPQRP